VISTQKSAFEGAMKECTLDILAGKVLDARAQFDLQLHGEQTYPLRAFEELWLALNQYAAALGDSRSMNYPAASYGVSKAPIRNGPFAASCGELTRMRIK